MFHFSMGTTPGHTLKEAELAIVIPATCCFDCCFKSSWGSKTCHPLWFCEGFDLRHVEDGELGQAAGWQYQGFHFNDAAESAGGFASAGGSAPLSHWDPSSQRDLETGADHPTLATALPELQTAGRERCLEANEMQTRYLEDQEDLEQVP